MVFQHAALFPHLSVRGNLEFARRRVPAGQARVDFDHVLALLGLEPLLSACREHLSGGERQRVAIGRALAASPSLLLLDEPLASLDLKRRAELLPCLQAMQAELDIPALYVSHAPEEVAQLASHVVLLEARRRARQRRDGRAADAAGPAAGARRQRPGRARGDGARRTTAPTASRGVRFDGGELLLPSACAVPGARRVVRVLARDVSLTLSRHADTSILNILPVTVLALADDTPGHVMVRLGAGRLDAAGARDAPLGRRTCPAPGLAVQAQIKGAAIG